MTIIQGYTDVQKGDLQGVVLGEEDRVTTTRVFKNCKWE